MNPLPVSPIPCLQDNRAWGIPLGSEEAAVVDPSDAAPVQRWLAGRGLRLRWILLTHHHGDHTGGASALAERHGAAVVGAAADRHRLPPLDRAVRDGDALELGPYRARVLAVPGHTLGHVAYSVADALFSGDALFAFGCGRVFEGDPAQMWDSLSRLRAAPGARQLCCGHEYTSSNLRFARWLLPDDGALELAEARVLTRLDQGQSSLPSPMDEQRALNPFLRCDDPALAARLGLEPDPVTVFAHIRALKDRFRG